MIGLLWIVKLFFIYTGAITLQSSRPTKENLGQGRNGPTSDKRHLQDQLGLQQAGPSKHSCSALSADVCHKSPTIFPPKTWSEWLWLGAEMLLFPSAAAHFMWSVTEWFDEYENDIKSCAVSYSLIIEAFHWYNRITKKETHKHIKRKYSWHYSEKHYITQLVKGVFVDKYR